MIARTASKLCPVAMMERYLNLGQIAGQDLPDLPLFRGITNNRGGGKLRKSGGLSYSSMRD